MTPAARRAERTPLVHRRGRRRAGLRAAARPAGVLRLAALPDAALDRARDLVEHPVRLHRLLLVRPRRLLRRRPVHDEHAAGALRLAVPVDAAGRRGGRRAARRRRSARSCSASRACAASCSRCSRWRSPSCIGTIVVNTPIDGGPGVSLSAVPVPKIGPTPSVDLLPARARRGRGDAAGRLARSCVSQLRRRPVRDPRRRGRGRGDRRADLPLQAGRARDLVRAGRRRRRHPCAVPLLRDGRRGVHDHGAADGGADERARRHAATGPARRSARSRSPRCSTASPPPTTRSPARR